MLFTLLTTLLLGVTPVDTLIIRYDGVPLELEVFTIEDSNPTHLGEVEIPVENLRADISFSSVLPGIIKRWNPNVIRIHPSVKELFDDITEYEIKCPRRRRRIR